MGLKLCEVWQDSVSVFREDCFDGIWACERLVVTKLLKRMERQYSIVRHCDGLQRCSKVAQKYIGVSS